VEALFLIPKRLHFVWVGDESKRPDAEIQSWIDKNPTYKVKVWGNSDLKEGWLLAKHMRHFSQRELCGVADCMRWEILYNHGGIALDADSLCVRPLEDWLLEPDVFASWESETKRPGLIANGVVGSVPRHPFIGQIIKDLENDTPGDRMAWEFSGPARITQTMHEHEFSDLTVYPSHYFLPEHFAGSRYTGKGQVFATQEWKSTRGGWQ